MESLWKLELDNYEPVIRPPETIVALQCKYLEELTEGRVIANVSKYKDPIFDYLNESRTDVQENLGVVGNVPNMFFNYEFYLTSPSTPKYKYRIMFFSYAIGQYPVNLVLDEDIAIDISEDENVICVSEDEFKASLMQIFRSDKVKSVIRALNIISKKESEQNNMESNT